MANIINFTDLETKGFLVIPNFLDNETIKKYKEHYSEIKSLPKQNKNYEVIVSKKEFIKNQLELLMQTISKYTNIKINLIAPHTTYFDNSLIKFDWHQDHEPYYIWQDSYNSINCWIPIIKPNPETSGINIIPFDRLEKYCLNIVESKLKGKGAKRFRVQLDGTTQMINDSDGTTTILLFNLDTLSESPILNEGDLIMLRNDVIHKTQNVTDNRLAISIRCINGNTIITRDNFLNSCEVKENMIANNSRGFALINQKFIKENLESMSLSDLYINI